MTLQLEKLRIHSNACDFPLLIPILRSSPLLERLRLDVAKRPATYVYSDRHRANIAELAQVLHESCPHLQELTVVNLPIDRTDLHVLLSWSYFSFSSVSCSSSSSSPALIATKPPQSSFSLRVLQLEDTNVLQHEVLHLITTEPSVTVALQNTLEILELKPAIRCRHPVVACPNLVWILQHFKRLKRVIAGRLSVHLEDFYESPALQSPSPSSTSATPPPLFCEARQWIP